MIIDFHTHIFSKQVKENRSSYIARDPRFAEIHLDPKVKIISAEDLIDSMDQSGIDISVILGFYWTTNELCVENNDYILESIARYPKRLAGFCSVCLESGEAALKEVERCAKSGVKGIGEMRSERETFKNKSILDSFADVLKRNNLILLTHSSEPVGHIYPGKGDVTPDVLYLLFNGLPEQTIVFAHWGGGLPFYALMPEVQKAMKNVYFDAAASPLLYNPSIYPTAIQLVGAERVLFGTDYPLLPQRRELKEIDSQNLPAEAKELLLAGNARRLLGLKG